MPLTVPIHSRNEGRVQFVSVVAFHGLLLVEELTQWLQVLTIPKHITESRLVHFERGTVAHVFDCTMPEEWTFHFGLALDMIAKGHLPCIIEEAQFQDRVLMFNMEFNVSVIVHKVSMSWMTLLKMSRCATGHEDTSHDGDNREDIKEEDKNRCGVYYHSKDDGSLVFVLVETNKKTHNPRNRKKGLALHQPRHQGSPAFHQPRVPGGRPLIIGTPQAAHPSIWVV